MPVLLSWFNRDRDIVLFTVVDPWTHEEFREADEQAKQWAAQSGRIVDAIMDFTNARTVPPGGFLTRIKQTAMQSRQAENVGFSAIVNMHPAQESVARAILRAYPVLNQVFCCVQSREEGLEIIEAVKVQRDIRRNSQSA